ncbi:unnamed protein product [Pieris brassicae]|uniref:Uncharacterized protein n=1 Tax=Pieris brassicae TaxID=7116 RepID=A0A9P0T3W4_PIEBR|nr:unnamed protein product [Pieris brassicae]
MLSGAGRARAGHGGLLLVTAVRRCGRPRRALHATARARSLPAPRHPPCARIRSHAAPQCSDLTQTSTFDAPLTCDYL